MQKATGREHRKPIQLLLAQLKACGCSKNLEEGKRVHAEAIESGNASNIYVASTLINMYAKCSSMVNARRVFDSIKRPNTVAWTTLILGFADNGDGATGLDLFAGMLLQGCPPDSRAFGAAIKACTSLALKASGRAHGWAKELHLLAVESGCSSDIFVQSSLIDMYAKCGNMPGARNVFDRIKLPDTVSWNALMLGYAANGEGSAALDLFAWMTAQGFATDSTTFVAALKACTSLAADQVEFLERVKQLELLASTNGCDSDIYVQNTLIDTFSKCGSMVEARRVFTNMKHPDLVSWNALIMGYAVNGEGPTALDLFARMNSEGYVPNATTFVAALKACTSPSPMLYRGKLVHTLASEGGCDSDVYVQTTLIEMYSRCSCLLHAQKVFDGIGHPDVVSWTALMLGYAENGDGVTALELFKLSQHGCLPDSTTFVAAVKACALLGALEFGRKIHADINKTGLKYNVILVTCLVDFYAKCGSMVEACQVFDSHTRRRDLTTWNALLTGYSRLGDARAALALFQAMQDAGFQPNRVTFTCMLTCCSHAGLVGKGKECFEAMSKKYGLVPSVEHYTCMVDILGRANKLVDAVVLLRSMPCQPNSVTWMTLLGACRKWKDVAVGKLAFESLLSSDDTNAVAAACVLMDQIYAFRGMHSEREFVLEKRRASKEPGQSWWVNEMGEIHAFLAGQFEPFISEYSHRATNGRSDGPKQTGKMHFH